MTGEIKDWIKVKQITVINKAQNAGQTGRPAYFEANVDVKVGGWFNASKSQLDFGTAGTGEVTGAASVHNCELYLPNKTMTGGEYQVLELNLQAQASTKSHGNIAYPISFVKFKLSGATKTTLEDEANCVLFQIDGFDGGANSCVDLQGAPGAVDGNIRISIGGADWFIPIASAGA